VECALRARAKSFLLFSRTLSRLPGPTPGPTRDAAAVFSQLPISMIPRLQPPITTLTPPVAVYYVHLTRGLTCRSSAIFVEALHFHRFPDPEEIRDRK